jgi:hypothetical protein
VAVAIRLDHAGDLDLGAHDGADVAIVERDLLARYDDVAAVRSGHCFYFSVVCTILALRNRHGA